MAHVELKNLRKIYPNQVEAIKRLNLKIDAGEFLVIVGPSGSGKTTLLRMIAGLEKTTEGEVCFDGVCMNQLDPKNRKIAMVFQTPALFPDLTVRENILFGYEGDHKKLDEAVAFLKISDLLDRKPLQLSGGQRQRVSLARAMIRTSSVFLFDEPLSSLDAKLKNQARQEIVKMHQKKKSTFIYVTHDQNEALSMASRVVVMNKGEIVQVASPSELYNYPSNLFVATFIGDVQMNVVDVVIRSKNQRYGLVLDETFVKLNHLGLNQYVDQSIVMGLRAEDFYLYKDKKEGSFKGNVVSMEYAGANIYLNVEVCGYTFVIKTTQDFEFASEVWVEFELNKIHLFDKVTKMRIG